MAGAVAAFGSGARGRAETGPHSLIERGRLTFAELGQSEPVTLTAAAPSMALDVTLPDDAAQGDPVWYGLYLHYEWNGVPGVDEQGYMYGFWNGRALYQLKVKSDPRWPGAGISWSMVDLVSGGTRSLEVSGSFSAASTNFAVISSVQPGPNTVSVALDSLYLRLNPGMTATIYPDSAIVATRWQPARVDWSASAKVSDDTVRLGVDGQNKGWDAPSLSIETTAYYADGSLSQQMSEIQPGLGPGAKFEAEVEVPVRERPLAVDATLSWGTGSSPKRVFGADDGGGLPLPFELGGAVYWVAVALFAIAWVSFSTAFSAPSARGGSQPLRRPRLPASRTVRLALAVSAVAGVGVALFLLAPGPWDDGGGPGPYPFARFPEFPVLQPSDVTRAEAILLAAAPELGDQPWQTRQAMPATRGGEKIGVFAEVEGKNGAPLTLLPEHLRGSCAAADAGPGEGLLVLVDLDAGAVLLLAPADAEGNCTAAQ